MTSLWMKVRTSPCWLSLLKLPFGFNLNESDYFWKGEWLSPVWKPKNTSFTPQVFCSFRKGRKFFQIWLDLSKKQSKVLVHEPSSLLYFPVLTLLPLSPSNYSTFSVIHVSLGCSAQRAETWFCFKFTAALNFLVCLRDWFPLAYLMSRNII